MPDSESMGKHDDWPIVDQNGDEPSLSAGVPGPTSPNARKPSIWLIASFGGGALVLAGVVALVLSLVQPSAIQRASDACSGSQPLQAFLDELNPSESPAPEDEVNDAEADPFAELFEGVVRVEDGGKTLIVNTKPQDDDPLGMTALALDCVYEQLDIPKSISERIGVTRALDGRQDGDWNGFTASWGYHPDNGLNLIIAQK